MRRLDDPSYFSTQQAVLQQQMQNREKKFYGKILLSVSLLQQRAEVIAFL